MPGSLTTRSRTASRDGETACVAFGVRHTLGAPDGITIAAQWLAYAHPYRRFASVLADRRARLGADVGRYSFIAEDLHLLSPAGLPAHTWIIHRSGEAVASVVLAAVPSRCTEGAVIRVKSTTRPLLDPQPGRMARRVSGI
jgi:hypothetical protein